ncbi:MAG: SsrA-binding protein [Flavobacteriales bacterium]|nr:SsrA-binding protein [Flavobacteriales bacterium]|tara:strand:+ start:548 stop:1006 length:459 start_codon:yes stop_codon:yes gene_type:complete
MNKKNNIINTNKKASFSYQLSDFFTCGIQLKGSEIKSIRMNQVNISESYCIIEGNEVWVKNMDIARYKFCTDDKYNPKKTRKLLLKKIEIKKINKNLNEKGMSLIPTKLFINETGLAKLEIAIGKGKKIYDKRESIKKADAQREMQRKKREK